MTSSSPEHPTGGFPRLEATVTDSTLARVFHTAPVAMGIIVDREIVEVNAMVCRLIGRTREDLVGQSVRTLYASDEDYELIGRQVYSQVAAAGLATASTTWRRGDGSRIEVFLSVAPLDANHPDRGIVAVAQDITAQRTAERSLRRSEERYRALFDGSRAMNVVIDLQGRIRNANAAAARVLECPLEELIGADSLSFVAPESRREAREALSRRVLGADVSLGGFDVFTRNGARRTLMLAVGEMEVSDSGSPQGIMISGVDITEHRRAKEERDRLFDLSMDLLCVAGFDGSFKQLNPSWTQALGWTKDELLATPWLDLVHPDDKRATIAAGEQLAAGRMVHQFENRYRCKDGSWRWLSWNSFPIVEEGLIFAAVRDITTEKGAAAALRQSEEKYRLLVENANEAIVVVQDIHIRYANPQTSRITGWTREELEGKSYADILHPEDLRRAMERDASQIAGSALDAARYRAFDADGHIVWVEINAVPITWEDAPATLNFISDITERVRAEEALRESEEKYRSLVEHANEAVVVVQNGVIAFHNPRTAELSGHSNDALDGMPVQRLVHAEDWAMVRDRNLACIKGERVRDVFAFRGVSANGEVRHIQMSLVATTWEGRPAILSLLSDITERVRTETALRESEEKYRVLIENTTEAITVVQDGVFKFLNPAAASAGRGDDSSLLKPFTQRMHPDDRARIQRRQERILAGEALPPEESRIIASDGREIWVSANSVRIEWEGRPATLNFGVDITARRKAEDALRLTQFTVDNAGEAVFWFAPDGDVIYANKAAAMFLGYTRDELLSMNAADIYSVTRAQVLQGWPELAERGSFTREVSMKRKDGTQLDVEVSANHVSFGGVEMSCSFIRDITERKALEARLLQAQKMEAIGMLAGGVAHDFNNQLTVIQGFTELLLADTPDGAASRGDLQEIYRAGERARQLTSQLLAFSRRQVLRPEPTDVHAALHQMMTTLERIVGENVHLSLHVTSALGTVRLDRSQFEQALMNLVINARDAMPAGGDIRISARNVTLDENEATSSVDVAPGSYVAVDVTDTGVGMDAETRKQVFEPFFTTKDVGKGSGLGLSMVYGFVRQSSGGIEALSEPGKGTTFRLFFPVVAAKPASTGPVQQEGGARGTGTILVVEDEDSVRQYVRRTLRESGYTVLESANAREALPLGENYEDEIDLLLTDVVMPGLSGPQLASRLKVKRPGMAVVYMSGYSRDARIGTDDVPGQGFLSKPFNRADLLRAVRRALESRA